MFGSSWHALHEHCGLGTTAATSIFQHRFPSFSALQRDMTELHTIRKQQKSCSDQETIVWSGATRTFRCSSLRSATRVCNHVRSKECMRVPVAVFRSTLISVVGLELCRVLDRVRTHAHGASRS